MKKHGTDHKHYILALLVASIAFFIYLPALRNGFIMDWDDQKMVFNPAIRAFDLDMLKWVFSADANDTIGPLYVFSFALDYALWGLNPLGYHLTSIIFHSINAFLLFVLLVRIFECRVKINKPDKINSTALGASFLAALLFAIHPFNVESVAWISARNGPMSSTFFIGSIYTYLNYSISQRKPYLYASLALFIVALLIKPTAATLPGILLIIDYALLKRLSFKKRFKEIEGVLLEKIPFFIIGMFSLGANALLRQGAGFVTDTEPLPFALRIFVVIRAMGFYLYKVLFPVKLVPVYAYPAKVNITNLEYSGSLVLVSAIIMACILYREKSPLYLSLWSYYFFMLLPILISFLGPFSTRRYAEADRYSYLVCIALFFLLGLGISRFYELSTKKIRYVFIPLITAMFVFFAIRTVDQTAIWHDPVSLWSHQIGVFPSTYEAHINRGTAYYKDGKYDLALLDYNTAIEIGPNFADGYYNRGNVYSAMEETDKAIKDFTKAIEIYPNKPDVLCNRGNAFNSSGNFKKAIEDFTSAIELNPNNADFYFNRSLSYAGLGQLHDAIQDLNKTIELDPYDADAYFYRGEAFSRIGKYSDAERDYKTAAYLGSNK